jgi:type I restriction enzyme S subunit
VQATLNLRDVLSLSIPLPPLEPRRAITHILETLDDKIELNRRTNETLEGMARALFKSWFVDFDPVHAKKEGRKPHGMDAATAAVLPAAFEHSAIGPIPQGWACEPVGALVAALSGGTPSKNDPSLWNGPIPWISPKIMRSIHVYESEARVSIDAVGNGTRLAPAGSTLVMVRGMGLHEEVRVSQALRDVAFNQDVKALVPARIHSALLLFALLDGQADLLTRVESSGHGTGRLPSDILLAHPITLPGGAVQATLARPFECMNEKIGALRHQSECLIALRDALLPKLLSGEIRVPEAERIVGKAV